MVQTSTHVSQTSDQLCASSSFSVSKDIFRNLATTQDVSTHDPNIWDSILLFSLCPKMIPVSKVLQDVHRHIMVNRYRAFHFLLGHKFLLKAEISRDSASSLGALQCKVYTKTPFGNLPTKYTIGTHFL